MDIMNVAPENHDYDGLSGNSTDLERLNTVFKLMQVHQNGIFLEYDKLFIPENRQRVFLVNLNNTGLIEQGAYPQSIRLSSKGLIAMDTYNSYSSYFNSNKPQRILQFLKPYGSNNFINISPLLSELFPLSENDGLHDVQEKGIEVRKLINGMVDDSLIKLDSTEINKLGGGSGGKRDWFNDLKITASIVDRNTPIVDNSINFHGNFTGNANTGSVGGNQESSFTDVKSSKADHSKATPITKSKIDVPLILKIIAGIIVIIVAILKGCDKI